MRITWKVVERCEWTVLTIATLYVIGHIALWIARGLKVI